jgi:hypothetical protein
MNNATPEDVQRLFDKFLTKDYKTTAYNMTLNEGELRLFTAYPCSAIQTSLFSTRKWCQKRASEGTILTRSALIKSVMGSCIYNVRKSSKPRREDLELMLDSFSANATVEGDWTLLSATMQDLLNVYGTEAMKNALLSVGRFPVEDAQAAEDALRFTLEVENCKQQETKLLQESPC